jgi:hypothetical protein
MLILFLHHVALAHLLHCTVLLSAHVHSYTLGHVVPELEEPMEQAQAEDPANLALDQVKPWCINQCSLSFILNLS